VTYHALDRRLAAFRAGYLRPAPADPDPASDFDHDAGGIRFSYGTETIYLDEEGRLVD
jgi:hypothetical protein